ncbi:methyltransferase domain-containing protein [Shimia sp.]|uniref:methyltransferase domain-containing protein n=1 Tax=Shimia sp. TaxID=1954381 RepID=UPI00329A32EE
MLRFDADTLKIINESYLGSDITRRRMENMRMLAPRPGEVILDLGCGQGLLSQELARAVGPTGRIIGVDISPDMLDTARKGCADYTNIDILEGAAGRLPVDSAFLDAAISLQVFEYLPDVAQALEDLHSKLRPGGRLVIGDMHFDTLAWASDNPDRMRRMCKAWEDHVADPHLPASLPAALHNAGFQLIELRPVNFSCTNLRPNSLAFMMMHLMKAYAVQNGFVSADEAQAWFDEQVDRNAAGTFFFSLTHFVAFAIRP